MMVRRHPGPGAGVMGVRSPSRSETGVSGAGGGREEPGDKAVKLDTLHSIR